MGRFQRILYLERRRHGSTRAFSCAVHAALEHGARLTLAGTGRWLERMAALAEILDVAVDRRGVDGGAPSELAAGHDLVITVGRVRGAGWLRLGGVERGLLRSCACPTWLLHPAQSPEVRVVVAAVDVSAPDGVALARRVVGTAAELAASGAELHVAHCWSVVGESLLASRSRGGSRRGAERVLAEAERTRCRRIERLLEAESVGSARIVLCKDKVVAGLREIAWRTEADVVVVGTAGRTGVRALFPGNTAERLIGRVPASVLVVPAGARVPSPSRRPSRDGITGSRGGRPWRTDRRQRVS